MWCYSILLSFLLLTSSEGTFSNGRHYEETEFPWVVSVRDHAMHHLKLGTLVSMSTVLTTCYPSPFDSNQDDLYYHNRNMSVIAGFRKDGKPKGDWGFLQRQKTVEVYCHPKCNAHRIPLVPPFQYDYALIRLIHPFQETPLYNLNSAINAGAVPEIVKIPEVGEQNCTVITGTGQTLLYVIEVVPKKDTVCENPLCKRYQDYCAENPSYWSLRGRQQFCVMSKDINEKSTGGQGGPFMCSNKLLGILSWGVDNSDTMMISSIFGAWKWMASIVKDLPGRTLENSTTTTTEEPIAGISAPLIHHNSLPMISLFLLKSTATIFYEMLCCSAQIH